MTKFKTFNVIDKKKKTRKKTFNILYFSTDFINVSLIEMNTYKMEVLKKVIINSTR